MKCVIVLDRALSPGAAANVAAVLALTLGHRVDGLIGPDIPDGDGRLHAGITTRPVAVLNTDAGSLASLRRALFEHDRAGLLVVDFSDAARATRTYEDYTARLGGTAESDLTYFGIALAGPAKRVASLTGALALYR